MYQTVQRSGILSIEFSKDDSMLLWEIADKRKMSPHEILDEVINTYVKENKQYLKEAFEKLSYQQVIFDIRSM